MQSYSKESFKFMENTLRVIFPIDEDLQALMEEEAQATPQVPRKYPASTPQDTMQVPCKYHASTMQVTMQVKDLLNILKEVSYREEIQEKLGLKNRDYFRKNYLNPAIEQGFVALTIPDKPTSSKQQYYLTDKGKEFLKTLK